MSTLCPLLLVNNILQLLFATTITTSEATLSSISSDNSKNNSNIDNYDNNNNNTNNNNKNNNNMLSSLLNTKSIQFLASSSMPPKTQTMNHRNINNCNDNQTSINNKRHKNKRYMKMVEVYNKNNNGNKNKNKNKNNTNNNNECNKPSTTTTDISNNKTTTTPPTAATDAISTSTNLTPNAENAAIITTATTININDVNDNDEKYKMIYEPYIIRINDEQMVNDEKTDDCITTGTTCISNITNDKYIKKMKKNVYFNPNKKNIVKFNDNVIVYTRNISKIDLHNTWIRKKEYKLIRENINLIIKEYRKKYFFDIMHINNHYNETTLDNKYKLNMLIYNKCNNNIKYYHNFFIKFNNINDNKIYNDNNNICVRGIEYYIIQNYSSHKFFHRNINRKLIILRYNNEYNKLLKQKYNNDDISVTNNDIIFNEEENVLNYCSSNNINTRTAMLTTFNSNSNPKLDNNQINNEISYHAVQNAINLAKQDTLDAIDACSDLEV